MQIESAPDSKTFIILFLFIPPIATICFLKLPFFNKEAYTTTIPAQFVKKFNCKVVPIYIERKPNINFEVKIFEPLKFEKSENIYEITQKLNKCLEKMILSNPSKWIWTHNRWK